MKNTFGNNLTMTIFGESHGPCIGITLDGLPSGFPVDQKAILEDMKKRKASGKISTQRHEDDIPQIVSGLFQGKTTGTPLTILISNQDQHSKDYESLKGRIQRISRLPRWRPFFRPFDSLYGGRRKHLQTNLSCSRSEDRFPFRTMRHDS